MTASGDGVVVGYPENTLDHSSLYGMIRFSRARLTTPHSGECRSGQARAPSYWMSRSHVSDSGPVTVTEVVDVRTVDPGAGSLTYADGSLGALPVDGSAWLEQAMTAGTDVSGISVKVVDAAGLTVSYPFDDDVSAPANGANLVAGARRRSDEV
ncbi:MAG: hypothetical protein R2706_17675 [Acidimicrobiales bacterium]